MNEQVQAIGFYKGLPIEDASSLIDLKVARQTAAGNRVHALKLWLSSFCIKTRTSTDNCSF